MNVENLEKIMQRLDWNIDYHRKKMDMFQTLKDKMEQEPEKFYELAQVALK